MVSRRQLEAYRKTQKRIETDFNIQLGRLWDRVKDLPVEDIRNILVDYVPDLIDRYGSMCASFAADWFEALVQENGFVPDLYSPDSFAASTRWALSPLWDGETDKGAAFAHLVSASNRHLRAYSRQTIAQCVERYPKVSYARVPTGVHTCEFCLLLASRGPVYGSKQVAQYASDGGRYHSDCDCVPVPMRGRWVVDGSERGVAWNGEKVAGYDFDQLYSDVYKSFHRDNDTVEQTVARMREAKTAHANLLLNIPEKRDWPASRRRELAFRQASLLSDTSGEKLDVDEIWAVEKLENLGHRVVWIPRERKNIQSKTNDFIWKNLDGQEWELKKSPPKYSKISTKIKRAQKDGDKRRFLINIGGSRLSEKLQHQLGRFNQYNPENRIERLSVLSANGMKLTKIDLDK